MNYVSFPGLGIEPFGIDPVAFKVFGIDVMWYGLIIVCGMILAYLFGLTRAKIEGVKSEDLTDTTLFMIIFAVIGARLYYVLFKLEDFIITDAGGVWQNIVASLKAIVNIRGGGLAIYGGLIGGFITLVVMARIKRIRIPVLLDIVAPCLFIGQLVGRWGNFMNVEAYGSVTELPWRMGVGTGGGAPYVHPTFLYESLWNLIGFILVLIFYKKKKFHGQVFTFYCIWYGIGRAVIEGLRSDSLMLGPIRVSQLLSVIIVIAGAVVMAIGMKKAPRVDLVKAAELRKRREAALASDGSSESTDGTARDSEPSSDPESSDDESVEEREREEVTESGDENGENN